MHVACSKLTRVRLHRRCPWVRFPRLGEPRTAAVRRIPTRLTRCMTAFRVFTSVRARQSAAGAQGWDCRARSRAGALLVVGQRRGGLRRRRAPRWRSSTPRQLLRLGTATGAPGAHACRRHGVRRTSARASASTGSATPMRVSRAVHTGIRILVSTGCQHHPVKLAQAPVYRLCVGLGSLLKRTLLATAWLLERRSVGAVAGMFNYRSVLEFAVCSAAQAHTDLGSLQLSRRLPGTLSVSMLASYSPTGRHMHEGASTTQWASASCTL